MTRSCVLNRKVLVFMMILVCVCLPVVAAGEGDGSSSTSYDMPEILSSLVSFVFSLFYKLFDLIESALVDIRMGNMDVPIFGSVYRALRHADMLEYQVPQGVNMVDDQYFLKKLCDLGIRLMESFKKLIGYMEMNIQNGYFPGLLREFFDYLDQELENYTFYKAWRGFVTSLPSYWITDILVRIFG